MKIGLTKLLASRLLTAGLLVPLLGTATACSSSDPEPPGSPETATSSSTTTSASTSPSTGGGPTTESPTGAVAGEEQAAAGQSPQPAPVPTFNAAEQVFLEGKVPPGFDPNAVLQAGQERCDLLLSAKASDPEAVVSELIMEPSSEVTDAVNALCTDLLPELEAAALGFPDGVFSVGEPAPHAEQPSIAPGTYRAYAATDGCSLSVYAESGELIGSYDGSSPAAIGADAARVDSNQCYSWSRS